MTVRSKKKSDENLNEVELSTADVQSESDFAEDPDEGITAVGQVPEHIANPKAAADRYEGPVNRFVDSITPHMQQVMQEPPAQDREARGEQLGLYSPLGLNAVYNRMFRTDQAGYKTQRAKIDDILLKEFGEVIRRPRNKFRQPEDRV